MGECESDNLNPQLKFSCKDIKVEAKSLQRWCSNSSLQHFFIIFGRALRGTMDTIKTTRHGWYLSTFTWYWHISIRILSTFETKLILITTNYICKGLQIHNNTLTHISVSDIAILQHCDWHTYCYLQYNAIYYYCATSKGCIIEYCTT